MGPEPPRLSQAVRSFAAVAAVEPVGAPKVPAAQVEAATALSAARVITELPIQVAVVVLTAAPVAAVS